MQNGGNPNHAITVTDIWPENMAELSRVREAKATRSRDERARSADEGARSPHEGTRSRGGDKEEPFNKTPIKKTPEEKLNGYPFHGQSFLTALAEYEEHRKEIRKPLRATGRKLLYTQLETFGENGATRALQASVANGWTGVFAPRGNGRGAESTDAVREVLNELEH